MNCSSLRQTLQRRHRSMRKTISLRTHQEKRHRTRFARRPIAKRPPRLQKKSALLRSWVKKVKNSGQNRSEHLKIGRRTMCRRTGGHGLLAEAMRKAEIGKEARNKETATTARKRGANALPGKNSDVKGPIAKNPLPWRFLSEPNLGEN